MLLRGRRFAAIPFFYLLLKKSHNFDFPQMKFTVVTFSLADGDGEVIYSAKKLIKFHAELQRFLSLHIDKILQRFSNNEESTFVVEVRKPSDHSLQIELF